MANGEDKTVNFSVSMPNSTLELLDALVEHMKAQNPEFGITRGTVVTAAVSEYVRSWAIKNLPEFGSKHVLAAVGKSLKSSEAERPPVDNPGLVYLIRSGNFFKIGKTENLSSRVRSIKTASPAAVEVVHTINCSKPHVIEKMLHSRFSEQRQNGEWFALSPEDIGWITSTNFNDCGAGGANG